MRELGDCSERRSVLVRVRVRVVNEGRRTAMTTACYLVEGGMADGGGGSIPEPIADDVVEGGVQRAASVGEIGYESVQEQGLRLGLGGGGSGGGGGAVVDGGRYEDMTAMEAVADDEGEGSVLSVVELGVPSIGIAFSNL